MERLLVESAVRAALIAAGTAGVLWMLGIGTAAARHRAWTGVVLLMLLLPVWSAVGPRLPLHLLEARPEPGEIRSLPALPGVTDYVAIPAAPTARSIHWRALLIGVYLLGAGALLTRLALGTLRARRLIRSAVVEKDRLTSGFCASPLTVGWLHPRIILPKTWPHWPKAQLDAVLTHEREHVRRYDPLVQWLALVNRAVFWFHPLAWWLERRLSALAEGACDAAVLAAGHTPQDYSEYLLDLARSTMRHGRRVNVAGMAMPGRNLTHRIRQIMEGVPMESISRKRLVCTIFLCTISSVVFAAATLEPQQSNPERTKTPTAQFLAETAARKAGPFIGEVQTSSLAERPKVVEVEMTEVLLKTQDGMMEAKKAVFQTELNKLSFAFGLQEKVPWLAGHPLALWPMTSEKSAMSALPCASCHAGPEGRQELTDDQRARIDRTLEYHRPNIASNLERLNKEETQLSRLLESDPVDRGAVLTQLDRALQARGDMERTHAALTLEMREYLTHGQWMQWQLTPSISINRVVEPRSINNLVDPQTPEAGPRGGRGQQ